MRGALRGAALILLIAFDAYVAFVIVAAIVNGGHGSVFWGAIVLLAAVLVGALLLTRRLASSFASRFARPSE